MNAPCKDCPERALHCHGTCERYAAYKRAKDAEIARRMADTAAADTTIRGVERIAKARRQKRRGR